MVALLERAGAFATSSHGDADVVAWTMKRAGGAVTWTAPGLADHPTIAIWAATALDGLNYADLLYRELIALAAV